MRPELTTHLLSTLEEKLIRINAVGNRAPNNRHPMEHNWRFLWVTEKQLLEDVEDDGEHDEGDKGHGADGERGELGQAVGQRAGYCVEEAHAGVVEWRWEMFRVSEVFHGIGRARGKELNALQLRCE